MPDNGCESNGQGRRDEDFRSQSESSDKHRSATEKVACARCRQRKIKCDRVNPCKQCIKSGTHCTYILHHKPKEKRQRVLISIVYESRLEHISNRIDDLSKTIKRLGDERPAIPDFKHPATLRAPRDLSHQSSETQISHQSTSQAGAIESTLFAHVIDTTRCIQDAVMVNLYTNIAAEVTSALDSLWAMVNLQKKENEILENSRPFPNEYACGSSARDLPIPPTERIMACLRIAQESPPSKFYWPFEFGSLGDFNQYVIKACSPGPITDMELIIVHYVLSWLFLECSHSIRDEAMRQDYEVHASTCRDSLEAIISNLSFHINVNIDSVCAMYMAALHCLRCGKPFIAWAFISKASIMSQSLGLHSSHIMATEPTDGVQRKTRLFWAVYVLEKSVSLRLGRVSTIRDQDITVPRLLMDRKMTSLLYNRMPDWIDLAELHGRVYDKLYSSNALAQPLSVRVSCANTLASELKRLIAARVEFYASSSDGIRHSLANFAHQERPNQWASHVIPSDIYRFLVHANRVIEHSILASIYKGAPSGNFSGLASCPECITAARVALEETEACISVISDGPTWPSSLDSWINEILLLAPFMPFLILLGNVVETSNLSDLERLQRLIDGLHLLTQSLRYSNCSKQLRIFKALYVVAANYVRTNAGSHPIDLLADHITDLDEDMYLNEDFGLIMGLSSE